MDDFTRIRKALFQVQEAAKGLAEELKKAEAERDEARDALRDLIGILEIAAVMPDAINKHMSIRIDDPGLQRARAALKGDAK